MNQPLVRSLETLLRLRRAAVELVANGKRPSDANQRRTITEICENSYAFLTHEMLKYLWRRNKAARRKFQCIRFVPAGPFSSTPRNASTPPSSSPTPDSAKPILATGSSKEKITSATSWTTPSSSALLLRFPGNSRVKAATTAASLPPLTNLNINPNTPGPHSPERRSAVTYGAICRKRTSGPFVLALTRNPPPIGKRVHHLTHANAPGVIAGRPPHPPTHPHLHPRRHLAPPALRGN